MDKTNQATKIYRAIRDSGSQGVANYKLARISLKYSSRISELRQDGHEIVAVRQYDRNGRALGTYNYHLTEPVIVLRKPTMFARVKKAMTHA